MADSEPLCTINSCGREVGNGTWMRVVIDGKKHTFRVCEEHWQANRSIVGHLGRWHAQVSR